MKRSLLVLVTNVLVALTVAQTPTDNSGLENQLLEISDQYDIPIYYAREWLDTLDAQNATLSGSLEEALNSVLGNTKLNYLVLDEKVILTYNTPILTELSFDSEDQTQNESQFVFAREYDANTDDPERQNHIIGKKSLMDVNGSSFLAGYIRNSENNEPLFGAYIQSDIATSSTDDRGFYTVRVPNGRSTVNIQFTGMKSTSRQLITFSDGDLNISMTPDVVILETVTLEADIDRNISESRMGIYSFDVEQMKNVPKVLGENDIIQIALTLPGVQNVGEGSAGISVRGGKTDQNLILFNNAPVYSPFHFFGFFSTFNADILQSSELYKSSIPVNFGGRLSSVLDVKSAPGNKEEVTGKGGVGIVTTSLRLDVPIIKEKTSVSIGGRSTYSDWILNTIDDENISNSDPYFYDFSANIDHAYGSGSSVNLSTYKSFDKFRLSTDSLYSYSNFSVALNWLHRFNEKYGIKLIATNSTYDYEIDYDEIPESAFDYDFGLSDAFGQVSFEYTPIESHNIQVGFDVRRYDIDPITQTPPNAESDIVPREVPGEKGIETSYFISDSYNINDNLSVYGGLRYSTYRSVGPGTTLLFVDGMPKNSTTVIDSVTFGDGEKIQSYHGPEVRLSMRYAIDDSRSIKASYNRTRQYIHTLSNTVSISPTDIWKLSDINIGPQIADQYSIGYFENFLDNSIETSVELYYKDLDNIIDYKTNADLVLNPTLTQDIIQGSGKNFGVEVLVRKNRGRLNGWATYTYSRSLQRFMSEFEEETINEGDFFPSNFDKPHIFNLVSNFKLTQRYSLSMNVNYATGRPVTYPTASYFLSNAPIAHFGDRNSFRIPNYFRVDIGVNFEGNHKLNKKVHGYWSLNVYNVLGRKNAYSVFFTNDEGNIQAYQLSVLAIPIPSVSYKFEF